MSCSRRIAHIAALVLLTSFIACSTALAIPVYLSPDSLYPTGQYNREWLEGRTNTRVTQRWLKVRAGDKVNGWVADDHVLSRLLLSTHGRMLGTTILKAEMREESRALGTLAPGARVRLLARNGRWFECQPEGTRITGFVPADRLRPDLDAPQMAYIKKSVFMQEQPAVRSETIFSLLAGERAEVIRLDSQWAAIRLRNRTGYVARSALILRDDLAANAVLSLRPALPLHGDSLPFADVVHRSAYLEPLRVLEERVEAWGRVSIADDGDVWWPLNEKAMTAFAQGVKPTVLKTSILFKRKIFDLAASPTDPSLKFASASGIFRTTDGKIWKKLDQFKNENHPISVTPSGRIFIGPYYSDDKGTTFQEYIRWPNLLASLHTRSIENVRILGVESAAEKIELVLNVGKQQSLHVASDDFGVTWRVLRQ